MAITYQRGTTGSTTLGAAVNIDISSDAVGDLCFVSIRNTGAVLPTVPAGWTTIATDSQGTTRQLTIAYRVKQSSDTTFSFTFTGGSPSSGWLLDVWRGGTYRQISTATNQAAGGNSIAFDALTVLASSASFLVGTWTNAGGSIIQETGYTAAQAATQIQSLYKLNLTAGVWDPPDAVLSNSVAQNRMGWQIEIQPANSPTYVSLNTQMDGVGALGPVARYDNNLAVTIAGASAIAETAEYDVPMASSIAGSGNLSGTTDLRAQLAASIAGNGALSAADRLEKNVAASLSGTGALALAGQYRAQLASSLAGTGDASPTMQAESLTSVALTGDGALAPGPAYLELDLATGIAGFGEFSLEPDTVLALAAALAGVGDAAFAPELDANLSAVVPGAGSLTVPAQFRLHIQTDIVSQGAFAAPRLTLDQALSLALVGQGQLTAANSLTKKLAAAVAAAGTLTPAARLERLMTGGISGVGTLADPLQEAMYLALALVGSGAMSATALQGNLGALLIAGVATLTLSPDFITDVAVGMTGTGNLIAVLGEAPVTGIKTGDIARSFSRPWIDSPEAGYQDFPAGGVAIL